MRWLTYFADRTLPVMGFSGVRQLLAFNVATAYRTSSPCAVLRVSVPFQKSSPAQSGRVKHALAAYHVLYLEPRLQFNYVGRKKEQATVNKMREGGRVGEREDFCQGLASLQLKNQSSDRHEI